MYDSNRGGLFTAVTASAIVLVLILSAKAIWDLSSLNTHYSQSAEYASAQHQNTAKKSIKSACLIGDADVFYECIYKKIKSEQDAKRSENDLAAQQKMALWAFVMALVSAGALLLTGVGVVFIWGTLNHTRRAADAAFAMVKEAKKTTVETGRIGGAQTRAYLWFDKNGDENFINVADDGLSFCFHFKNFGKTPANITEVFCGFKFLRARFKSC